MEKGIGEKDDRECFTELTIVWCQAYRYVFNSPCMLSLSHFTIGDPVSLTIHLGLVFKIEKIYISIRREQTK